MCTPCEGILDGSEWAQHPDGPDSNLAPAGFSIRRPDSNLAPDGFSIRRPDSNLAPDRPGLSPERRGLIALIDRRIDIAEALRNLDLTILQARAEKKLGWTPIFACRVVQEFPRFPANSAQNWRSQFGAKKCGALRVQSFPGTLNTIKKKQIAVRLFVL